MDRRAAARIDVDAAIVGPGEHRAVDQGFKTRHAIINAVAGNLCTIKRGDDAIGNETKVKVVKNKVAPPFKTAEFDILFGEGISRHGEIIDMGVEAKIIDKSGAWYAYNGEKIGQGRDNAREFLRENAELAAEIENKVRESLGIPLLAEAVNAA